MWLISGIFVLFYVQSARSADRCVVYSFEESYQDLFNSKTDLCSNVEQQWVKGEYSALGISSPSESSNAFISPMSSLSCVSSFDFSMSSGGTIEFNVYVSESSNTDYLSIIASQKNQDGDDSVVGNIALSLSNIEQGWSTQIMTLTGPESFEGYVSFFGIASENSTVLLDSFRYIPPGASAESCIIYEDTISTTPITEITTTFTTEADVPETTVGAEVTQEPEIAQTTEETFSTSQEPTITFSPTQEPEMTYSTTHEPEVTYSTTQEPTVSYSTTQEPEVTYSTTQEPTVSYSTTQEPEVTYSTTQEPEVTYSTTHEPEVTYSTTQEPEVTYSTTHEPEVTYSTTQEPEMTYSTTQEPTVSYSTTQEPTVSYSTTQEPEVTYSTTHEPEIITTTPASTTVDITTTPIDVTTEIADESCTTYNFESDYDLHFFNDNYLCDGYLPWQLDNYTSIDVTSPNSQSSVFITPHDTMSCINSFVFKMEPDGVVEANVYMDPVQALDHIIILAHRVTDREFDTTSGFKMYHPENQVFVTGWNVIKFSLLETTSFDGYLIFLGTADADSTVLVDSFRYIPPQTSSSDSSCNVY